MVNWQSIIFNDTIRLIKQTNSNVRKSKIHPAISSFAIEDTLATSVGAETSPTTMRLWIHDKTVVLGIPDTRLPYIEEGIKHIKQHGFHPIVRNSGGLAVALDKGVLNISLIFSNKQMTSIHKSYEIMFNFVKELLHHETTSIKAYEIVGSFCPGDYDLSINGVKFAGISQRRVRDGISVQIYLDVCGNHLQRSQLIQQFYQISRKNEQTSYNYPKINPNVMSSLADLLNRDISVQSIIKRLQELLNQSNINIVTTPFTNDEYDIYKKRLKQMVKRNEVIK